MKWSKSHLFTLKEAPSDAEIPSHKLMVRSGMIKKVAPGIFTYGFMGLRAIRKFENIIREELNRRDCIEILMPMVQPKELWAETNRWTEMGDGLLKFKNRTQQEFCLGATHEEIITDYVRHDIKSYRNLPVNIYQVQTKYRDEIRPRFGLMRGREFIMKDGYSFDRDSEGANKSYGDMYQAYQAIFDRLGLEYRIVEADSGNIGGNQTHEFQVLAGSGEDHILASDGDDYAANIEVCPAIDAEPYQSRETELRAIEKFATPTQKTIAEISLLTGVAENELVKTMFFSANDGTKLSDQELKPIAVLLRGNDEVNPVKLKKALGLVNPPLLLTDDEIKRVTNAFPGSCGPVGLKIPIYLDKGVEPLKNYITGANEDGFHIRNVNHGRDFNVKSVADIRMAREGDLSPTGKGRLKSYRGIEVGQVFYLGTKYSKSMNASYLNEQGQAVPMEMGCYGIGVTRTVQAAIEQSHDADGIIWPIAIAPFQVHLCLLDIADPLVKGKAEEIYKDLWSQGVEVFMDDRDERPGVKFKDADLLGMPLRVNVGKRGLSEGHLELIERKTKKNEKVPVAELCSKVLNWLDSANFKRK